MELNFYDVCLLNGCIKAKYPRQAAQIDADADKDRDTVIVTLLFGNFRMHSKVTGAQLKLFPFLCLLINVHISGKQTRRKKKQESMVKEIEINGNKMKMHWQRGWHPLVLGGLLPAFACFFPCPAPPSFSVIFPV